MKSNSIIIYLIITFISFIFIHSCERDDICAESTPTTPQIIFRFFDNVNRDDLRTVNSLLIQGLDDNNEVVDLIDRSIMSVDSIAVPLRTDANQTRFLFTLNANDEMMANVDTLTISYNRRDVFISRACGFSNNFDAIGVEVANDTLNWVLDSNILRENVEDEISAHVQIFH